MVLHVGLPKTGSSTIQNMLRANEEQLARQHGIRILLAPELKPLHRAIAALTRSSRPAPLRRIRVHLAVRRLRRRIASENAERIIISHEMILGFNSGSMFKTRFHEGPAQAIDALRKVFRGYEIRWVFYQRDLATAKRSAYNQNVKLREVCAEFPDWEQENCPDGVFDQLLRDLEAHLDGQLTRLDFDDAKHLERPLGQGVLALAGLSEAATRDLAAVPVVNESLPPDLLDLKRRLNALGLPRKALRDIMILLEEAYQLQPQKSDPDRSLPSKADNERFRR